MSERAKRIEMARMALAEIEADAQSRYDVWMRSRLSLIRAALSAPPESAPAPDEGRCAACDGNGRMYRNCAVPKCPDCNGTGLAPGKEGGR